MVWSLDPGTVKINFHLQFQSALIPGQAHAAAAPLLPPHSHDTPPAYCVIFAGQLQAWIVRRWPNGQSRGWLKSANKIKHVRALSPQLGPRLKLSKLRETQYILI